MVTKNLITQSDALNYLCAVCVSDNNGAKIALTVIILSFLLLGIANWAWKKYFVNKKEISQEK